MGASFLYCQGSPQTTKNADLDSKLKSRAELESVHSGCNEFRF